MKHSVSRLACALGVLAMATGAWASGTLVEEQGARAASEAGAFAARADDPSAIFYNPAGLAFQSNSLMFGFSAVRENMKWVSPEGVDRKGPIKTYFPAHAYLVLKTSLPVTFGMGVNTPYDLATEWASNWPGASIAERTIQRAVYYTPTVAFHLNDKWSLGLSADYVYSTLYMRQAVDFPAIPYPTPPLTRTPAPGMARLHGSGDGWGWGLGVLGKLDDHWQVGFSFRDKVKIDYTGSVDFFRIPTHPDFRPLFPQGGVKTSITLPSAYTMGVAYLTRRWSLEGDVTLVDWSVFKNLAIDFQHQGGEVRNTVSPANWKKAAKVKLGFEYKLSDRLRYGAGVYYDESAVPDKYGSPILPDSNRWSAQTGLSYTAGRWTLDSYIMYIYFQSKHVPADTPYVPGTYKASAEMAGLSLVYKF